MSDNGNCGSIIKESDCRHGWRDLDTHEMQEDGVGLTHMRQEMVNCLMLEAMEVPRMMFLALGGGVFGIFVAALFVGSITVLLVMDEGGADGATSAVDDGLELFGLGHRLPLRTIIQPGTGKGSSPRSVGMILFTNSTLAKLIPLFSPQFLDLFLRKFGSLRLLFGGCWLRSLSSIYLLVGGRRLTRRLPVQLFSMVSDCL